MKDLIEDNFMLLAKLNLKHIKAIFDSENANYSYDGCREILWHYGWTEDEIKCLDDDVTISIDTIIENTHEMSRKAFLEKHKNDKTENETDCEFLERWHGEEDFIELFNGNIIVFDLS